MFLVFKLWKPCRQKHPVMFVLHRLKSEFYRCKYHSQPQLLQGQSQESGAGRPQYRPSYGVQSWSRYARCPGGVLLNTGDRNPTIRWLAPGETYWGTVWYFPTKIDILEIIITEIVQTCRLVLTRACTWVSANNSLSVADISLGGAVLYTGVYKHTYSPCWQIVIKSTSIVNRKCFLSSNNVKFITKM